MKKVLFISYALPPYLYPQSIQIGRFLEQIKGKYDTYILCAEENTAPDPTLYPDFFEGIDPSKILRVPNRQNPYLSQIQNRLLPFFYKQPDPQRGWAERAFTAVTQKFPAEKFDCIVTFSFPLSLNLLGEKLKEYYGCTWVAHQSDPWADNPFMNFGPLTGAINRKLERRTFRAADKLVFTSLEAAEYFKAKYPDRRAEISYIDHSFGTQQVTGGVRAPERKKKIRYIGSMYGDRTAKPLLGALTKLSAAAIQNLNFEIVGAGLKTRLMLQQAGLPEGLVTFVGRVNYAESLRLMADSDVLLVIDAPLERDNIFFPSKLADYIGSGRPMIGISSPGPTQRILKSLGYACFTHDESDQLAAVLEQIASGAYPEVSLTPAQRAPYMASVNAQKLMDVIDHA